MKHILTTSILLFLLSGSMAQPALQTFAAAIDSAVQLQNSGESQQALDVLNAALKVTTVKNLPDSLRALAYHKKGVSYYYLMDYPAAISSFKNALQIRQKSFPTNHLDIVKGYHNIGDCYYLYGDSPSAQSYLEESIRLHLSRSTIDSNYIAKSYKVLGSTYTELGDFRQAEPYLQTALSYYRTLYKDEPWNLAALFNDFVLFYQAQGKSNAMVDYGKRALQLYKSIDEKDDYDNWGMADCYHNLAMSYYLQHNFAEALQHFQQSLRINQSFPQQRQLQQAQNYNNMIIVLRKMKRFQEAKQAFDQALALNLQQNNTLELALNYHNYADVEADQDHWQKALAHHQQSAQLLVSNFQPKDAYANPPVQGQPIANRFTLIEVLYGKAKALQALAQGSEPQKNYQAALATFDTITVLLDAIRQGFEADQSKSFLVKKARPMLEEAIALCLDLYDLTKQKQYQERAFEFAERSKAIILLEAVQEGQGKLLANLPPQLRQRERQLKTRLDELERELFGQETSNQQQLRTEWLTINRQLTTFTDSLERQFPVFHQQKYQLDWLPVATIQQELLAENQALVEYVVGEEELFLFLITKDDFQIVRQPLEFPLQQWIEEMREGIYQPFTSVQAISSAKQEAFAKTYQSAAWKLYQKLLQPIAEILPHRLIIIPDGVLGYIPFDALLTAQPASNIDFHDLPFLLQQHIISYSYSATLLSEMWQAPASTATYQLLGFAPSFRQKASPIAANTRSELGPLFHNQQEVESIAKLFAGKQFFGSEATKQHFQQFASDYSILHLSSHAKMDGENPDYSFISFSQLQDTLNETELLYVSDLYAMTLPADLVVLSACETALGQLDAGEGIISLARAFAYAGTRSLVTTLWRVNDQTTADLTVEFYKQLKVGKEKDEALWLAKKSVLEEGLHPHPYYWAGFIPVGDMRALPVQNHKPYWLLLGLAVLVFAGALVFRKWLKG